MSCNTRDNTVSFLKEKGILDNKSRILDQSLFDQEIEKYEKVAREKYGYYPDVSMFSIKRILRETGKADRLSRKTTITSKIAIANPEYFEGLEQAINDALLDDFYQPALASDFTQYMNYKRELLIGLNNRLKKVKAAERKESESTRLLALNKLERELTDRIEILEDEIAKLEHETLIERISNYVDSDIRRLAKLASTNHPENIKEAKKIINFYKAAGTFEVGNENPFFLQEEMFDTDGELLLDEDLVIKPLEDWKKQALKYENTINAKDLEALVNTINENDLVSEMYQRKLELGEILNHEYGLADADWFSMMIMDMTNGILSENGILPQVMQNTLNTNIDEKLEYSRKVNERIAELQPEVEDILSQIDNGKYKLSSLGILGVKGVSYELFRQKYDDGFSTDRIVDRFSPTYYDDRAKMFNIFRMTTEEARLETDAAKQRILFENAYQVRDAWLRRNTIMVNPTMLPEISGINDDSHKNQLISLLGINGYNETVEKQKFLLDKYKSQKDLFTEAYLVDEGVASYDDLSDDAKKAIRRWDKMNNPFETASTFVVGQRPSIGNFQLNTTQSFNITVPRKFKTISKLRAGKVIINENPNEPTDYYDKNFEIIDANPVLYEFHSIVKDVSETIRDILPYEEAQKFAVNSLPALRKSISEILLDKDTDTIQKLSTSYRRIIDNIKDLLGIKRPKSLSQAAIDPITGEPDYQVNSDFLKSNSKEIRRLYQIEMSKVGVLLGGRPSKYGSFTVDNLNQNVIDFLSTHLRTHNTKEAIKKKLGDDQIVIGKVIERSVTHNVVESNSFDLPKIVKLYSHLAMEYAGRNEALPIINMIKNHYKSIKKPKISNGQIISNARAGKTRFDGYRQNAIRQVDNWFERSVLGDYGSKNEFPGFIKRVLKIDMKGRLGSMINTNIDGKILSSEEKKIRKDIESLVATGKLSDQELETLVRILDDLGKDFSVAKSVDAIFNFIRFKTLGWGLSSALTNFLEGQVSNFIIAAQGDYFTPENIYRAMHVVSGSFMRNQSFGKLSTPGAAKARILMDRYRILQDASNELQKASYKSAVSGIKKFEPYEIVRRVEYLNQTPMMISILLDTPIKDKDGNTSNVWDAFNADGKLKEEFRTDENIDAWENAVGGEFNKFKSLINKAIVNTHGDYDDLRGNVASTFILGKAMMMFKRWIARQLYMRFAIKNHSDIETGVETYRGRYWSHTASSGLVQGSTIGFAIGGPVGSIIGGGIGFGYGQFFGQETQLSFLKELTLHSKLLLKKFYGIPINTIAGRKVVDDNFSQYEDLLSPGFTERDAKNLAANFTEMALVLQYISLSLFVKALSWDDDDEQDSPRRIAHNLIQNRINQVSSNAEQYSNPVTLAENIINMAPYRFLQEVGGVIDAVALYVDGQDVLATGPNAGESRLLNRSTKTFLPGFMKDQSFGFESQTRFHIGTQTPWDRWFWSDWKKADKQRKAQRAKRRQELEAAGYGEKAINKTLNREYPPIPK